MLSKMRNFIFQYLHVHPALNLQIQQENLQIIMEDRLLNEELSRSNGPRRWPVQLFECCAYRDIKVMMISKTE